MAVLTSIAIHPIKSCRRVELDQVEVSATGLRGDREWQIVREDRSVITQRDHRIMATISPEPIPGGLRISAPGHTSMEVVQPNGNDSLAYALLGDEVQVGDAGDAAAEWLTVVIGESCRLVAITSESERRIPLVRAQPISFVDAAPVLVANSASLDDLVARARSDFPMERFRPNLVVGDAEPWVEDTWRSFEIGAAKLVGILPWPRCPIPQIDQDTGERHKEPAVVLKAHRWCHEAPGLPEALRPILEGNALFGLACSIGEPGMILQVGDAVNVHETGDALLAPPVAL